MINKKEKTAILMLQDGTYFEGIGLGAIKKVCGEITFSTIPGSGYIEVLTDSTFKDQILVFTYPLIGNYGVPDKNIDQFGIPKHFESDSIKLKGIIINEYCKNPSHYEMVMTLEDWLIEEDIPGIQWIDTRMLTQKIVEKGTQLGILQVFDIGDKPNIEQLKEEVKNIKDPSNKDLIKSVSTEKIKKFLVTNPKGTIAVLDLGVKNNILRILLNEGYDIILIPNLYSYKNLTQLCPNGVILTNGPGNPYLCKQTIEFVKDLIDNNIPTLGIGLGNMLIGLAAGGECYKMVSEHRGGRTTVDKISNYCYITFQNHGYCIKNFEKNGFKELYYDKDDKTNEGLFHESKPIFSVAFNPEGSPGSLDLKDIIFSKFIKFMEE
ncbi:MAG: glutamine-hydrolyzing carbamoyl-phosphate synthase small subunit [Candidatus Lokiarchaeota archaeon]|nr:glutamine-hydrolyzing carbamoyl-phosphate synthase small subunit [Candidatus Lokiarchaeota archaeon]